MKFDREHTAVLSMDLQAGIVSRYLGDQSAPFLERVARTLGAVRACGMRIIHVRVGFRPGLPEISARNPLFAAVKQSPQHQQLFSGPTGEIHNAVAPREGDLVVTKHRVSAFAGTDLDLILRANDIATLVLLGIATSGVVLSTALHASDADYGLFVIGDCCADLDPAVHACLLEKVLPRKGSVLSSAEFVEALS